MVERWVMRRLWIILAAGLLFTTAGCESPREEEKSEKWPRPITDAERRYLRMYGGNSDTSEEARKTLKRREITERELEKVNKRRRERAIERREREERERARSRRR